MKNIVFDLGGVILKENPIIILDELDIDKKTYDELKIFFYDWKNLDLGYETLEEKFNKCNFRDDIVKKYKEYLVHYYKYREMDNELIDLMNTLKNKGFNIYVLSDNNKDASLYYKKLDCFKCVDGWVFSCDYNTLKIDGSLFDIFFEKYKLNPKECLFIDDREDNIKESIKHGMKGYLYGINSDINDINNLIINE